MNPPLAYDESAFELAPQFPRGLRPWSAKEIRDAIRSRATEEKKCRELHVYYYRIGHTLAFPLPLEQRPRKENLPEGIPGMAAYPWLTWLSWALEERWRVLQTAWRRLGDGEAGELLQRELAALDNWDSFCEGGNVSLVTGHLAGCLAHTLAHRDGWHQALHDRVQTAAHTLIERDIWPWFEKTWADDKPLTPGRLHNIPTISLVRAAQLARVIASPRTDALERRAREALCAWCTFRVGEEHHAEGAAYDGFLMDSVTEWVEGMPNRKALIAAAHDACASLVQQWLHQMLPGRPDLLVPLGDTEAEMPFWMNAAMRMARWYDWKDALWLLQRVTVARLPAATLEMAVDLPHSTSAPTAQPREHPAAVTLRTGWDCDDLLAAIGLSRNAMGHLHADCGHVIVAWQGRSWIVDPGYQQYRAGEERNFTIGPQAHNAPVIAGIAQSVRAPQLLALETCDGVQHAAIELAGCYKGFPKGASVRRDVWLVPGATRAVVVRDTFASLAAGVKVQHFWHGGAHFGWHFSNGWARLSDGARALWFRPLPGELEATKLTRHPGSRGPLTQEQDTTLADGRGTLWWVFCCDPALSWSPPAVAVQADRLKVGNVIVG